MANRGSRSGMSREEAGRKGGESTSQDREHMSKMGRKGGEHSSGNFSHDPQRAAQAGRKGGGSSGGKHR